MEGPKRSPLVPFDNIPGELPNSKLPDDLDIKSVAQDAVVKLNSLREEYLTSNAIWRDLLSLTDYYRTIYSSAKVYNTFKIRSALKKRSIFRIKDGREPRIEKAGPECSWVDVDILFTAQHENLAQNCMGTVSVAHIGNGQWRIWMLRTWLECFDGYGHPDVLEPSSANPADVPPKPDAVEEYGAVIIGGGQAGLSVAGRLKALGVSYLVVERNAEIGDVWNKRYESLRWHTSKEYGVLPFGHTFPAEDDYMLPTKRIGAGHKDWSNKFGINVRTNATVEAARWDAGSRSWSLDIAKPDRKLSIRAQNIVLAIGPGHGRPVYPAWATDDKVRSSGFKGTILHGFNGYDSAHEWAGKRGTVVGTANTGHDIAEDMANAGMQTTIVQRNPTFVFPAEWLHAAEDAHYREDTDAGVADRLEYTYPNKIMREKINRAVWAGIRANPERFDSLELAGFRLDRFGDIYTNLFVRFGGHYVDIGCSKRIADGEIKMKTEAVQGVTADGLLFEDGSEVGADLIVLCTGFNHDFREDAAKILGRDVADQMDEFWGVDQEGEIRGHAKLAGHPNLYYHGGDVRMARFFSQFVALQIQADALGKPLQPYFD